MIHYLASRLIPNHENHSEPKVRQAYGMLCGSVGIFFNIFLFAGKLAAGLFSNSISITADAFNNLSDAGSSIITLIGFRLSGQKPDPEHPFGHGRMEYISGFVVSLSIILMSAELLKSSAKKIFAPEEILYSPVIAVILFLSILVKLYMYYYNKKIAEQIQSTAMKATAADSLSDCRATLVVLTVALLTHFADAPAILDGICGVLVGISILFAGIKAARDTLNPLLGQPPQPEFVSRIEQLVMAHSDVLGIHDLIVHDYGPGRLIISLHAEVPANGDMLKLHDTIDNIEKTLGEQLNCTATIHMDPICNDDPLTIDLREKISVMLTSIDPCLTLHDFRIVTGPTHTNILFDIVSPYHFSMEDRELILQVSEQIRSLNATYHAMIQVDKAYQ